MTMHFLKKEKHERFCEYICTCSVNFGCQGLNIWQKYLFILITSTQAYKVEKKTL